MLIFGQQRIRVSVYWSFGLFLIIYSRKNCVAVHLAYQLYICLTSCIHIYRRVHIKQRRYIQCWDKWCTCCTDRNSSTSAIYFDSLRCLFFILGSTGFGKTIDNYRLNILAWTRPTMHDNWYQWHFCTRLLCLSILKTTV